MNIFDKPQFNIKTSSNTGCSPKDTKVILEWDWNGPNDDFVKSFEVQMLSGDVVEETKFVDLTYGQRMSTCFTLTSSNNDTPMPPQNSFRIRAISDDPNNQFGPWYTFGETFYKQTCCADFGFQAFDGSNRYFRRLKFNDFDCCFGG